jgi:hypothetical protein
MKTRMMRENNIVVDENPGAAREPQADQALVPAKRPRGIDNRSAGQDGNLSVNWRSDRLRRSYRRRRRPSRKRRGFMGPSWSGGESVLLPRGTYRDRGPDAERPAWRGGHKDG